MSVAWIGVIAVLVAWVWYRGTRPAVHGITGPEDVSRGIKVLLARGTAIGAFTVRLRRDAALAVHVTKYTRGVAGPGCRTELPESLSTDGFATLRAEFVSRAIAFQELDSAPERRLRLDFEADRGVATVAMWLAIEHLLSRRPVADCECFWTGVVISNTPRLTGLDSPDEPWTT